MKKLTLFIILLAIATGSIGQTISFTLTTAPCNHDGVLTANLTGFTPPLTVTWNTYGTAGTTITHTVSGTSDVLTSYSGGSVYVTVTDGTITTAGGYGGAAPFNYSIVTTPAICLSPGTATATITAGGTAPFSYQWYNIITSAIVSSANPASMPAGSYGVTITDALGCVFGSMDYNDSADIYTSSSLVVNTAVTTANCTNGTATVTSVSGAVMPLTYAWSTGATSAGMTGLSMGYYSVVVTDAVGCHGNGYANVSQSITISAPVTPTPATCTSSDGAVIAFGSGGLPPYSYLWSNGATTQSQTGLSAGYYGVTVTDANGCFGNSGGDVGVSTPITVTSSATSSLCTSATGTASIAPAGGTSPYSVLWYATPPQTTTTATALAPGSYNFKVTDAVGCIRTGAVNVPPVNIITASYTASSATCTLSNGGLHVYPAGGATPYNYLWSTGSTTSSISSVPSGYYNVAITDAAGCTIHKYLNVPVYSPMSLGTTSTPASCIFNSDGAVTATAYGGTAPYTYSWGSSSLTGISTGGYFVNVSDATGCETAGYAYVGYDASNTSCYCTITGVVYQDLNGNCVQDAGEPGIPNVQIYCSGIGYTYTNVSGQYSFIAPSGTYTISETVLAFYPLSPCQLNNIPVTVAASTGCVNTINFANSVTPIHDVHISTWDYNHAIPGNTYNQVTVISNDGTITESSILAGYNADGQIFAPSFIPSGIFSGSAYWYNTAAGFPTLAPGAAQTFHETYSVPTSVPLGTNLLFKDSVAHTAPISTWLTDYSPWNNVNYFSTTTVSSYDPNFKEVSPKGTGPTGLIPATDTVLEYMVHFQNTGTYFANNVVVIDTLDNNLDWTSLRPVYQSAQGKVTLEQAGAFKIATFTFANINLPAQITDDLRSNAMFTYTVKVLPGLTAGSQIRNRASIYFDYNAPVMTQSTLNTIDGTAAISNVPVQNVNSFSVYPNPAQQSFNVLINSENAGMAELKVSDITGKILISKGIAIVKGTQTITTNVNQFAPGVYFVSLVESGKARTEKLVVIR
jgi:uncharacterized repeat protein (TIGR01451 family)